MVKEKNPSKSAKKPKPAKKAPVKKKVASKATEKAKKPTKSKVKPAKATKKPAKKPAKKKAAKKKKTKSRGRPAFVISEETIHEAYDLAATGLTKKEIAACLGIHYDTLNEKAKSFSDFSEAIEEGRAVSVSNVANALYQRALTGDVPAIKYFLSNRAPDKWKDKREHHVLTEEVNREVTNEELEDMSDEELEVIASAKNVTLIGVK